MNRDFVGAMRRATALVRDRNLAEATSTIRRALGRHANWIGPDAGQAPEPASPPQPRLPQPDAHAAARANSERSSRAPEDIAPLRRSLGETIRALRNGKPATGLAGLKRDWPQPGRPTPQDEMPEGAQFLARSFACPAGARRYRLYVPAIRLDQLRGLVVMLHGCSQTAEDFAAGTRMNRMAEANRLLVAYPQQDNSANPAACWNWFDPAHQAASAGEPAVIVALTRTLIGEFGIAPQRVFVAGLSAGGAMAAVLAETAPELFAAIGIHSGLPFGVACDVTSAFAAMREGRAPALPADSSGRVVPTIVFHGDQDSTVHPRNGEHVIRAAGAGMDLRLRQRQGQVPDGRAFTRRLHLDGRDCVVLEHWLIHGGGHAWSGGDARGSYTDPQGPDASQEMVRFFLER